MTARMSLGPPPGGYRYEPGPRKGYSSAGPRRCFNTLLFLRLCARGFEEEQIESVIMYRVRKWNTCCNLACTSADAWCVELPTIGCNLYVIASSGTIKTHRHQTKPQVSTITVNCISIYSHLSTHTWLDKNGCCITASWGSGCCVSMHQLTRLPATKSLSMTCHV